MPCVWLSTFHIKISLFSTLGEVSPSKSTPDQSICRSVHQALAKICAWIVTAFRFTMGYGKFVKSKISVKKEWSNKKLHQSR